MTQTVHDALASHRVETTVHRRLHDVRPHAVYEVEFDGRRAICKVARHAEGSPAVEGSVLAFVDEATSVPVPQILATGDEHFVAAWCPGLPDDPTVDHATLRAMGAGMARLHDETADHVDATGRPIVSDGNDEAGSLDVDEDHCWSDTLCALLDDRRRFLEPHGYADLAREAHAFVEAFEWAFDAAGAPALLHGNVLPEHAAVDRSGADPRLTRLIDFEHALVGPPSFDLSRSLGPLFGPPSARPEDDDRIAFLDGYRSVRPLPPDLDHQLRLLEVVNAVSYVRSLHLQRGDRDPIESVARRARGLANHARARMAELRTELQAG